MDVLADVDEDNFDRAFDILRPGTLYDTRLSYVVILSVNVNYAVIQGTADVGKKLSEDELEKTMDFCRREYSILCIYS